MDDPIFEPWNAASDPSRTRRWRAAIDSRSPTRPPPRAEEGLEPSLQSDVRRSRLPGTLGFLRNMALPRLHDVAQRLRTSRHVATVDDDLELSTPVLRLIVRPWRGPLVDDSGSALVARFEVGPGVGTDDERIRVRAWLDASGDELVSDSVPTGRFGAAWLEARLHDFVGQLLARA